MAVIPYYNETENEQLFYGNSGHIYNPEVTCQPDFRASQVLQADGTPYLVGVKKFKIGFDLCRRS